MVDELVAARVESECLREYGCCMYLIGNGVKVVYRYIKLMYPGN